MHPLVEEGVDTHAHQRAIGKVESNWSVATNLVANLHRTALHLQAKLLHLAFEKVVEDMRLRDLAEFRMTMFVIAEVDTAVFDLLIAERVEHTFRYHGSAIVDTHQFALHNAADHHIDNLVDGDFALVEELGDYNHRVVAGAGDA